MKELLIAIAGLLVLPLTVYLIYMILYDPKKYRDIKESRDKNADKLREDLKKIFGSLTGITFTVVVRRRGGTVTSMETDLRGRIAASGIRITPTPTSTGNHLYKNQKSDKETHVTVIGTYGEKKLWWPHWRIRSIPLHVLDLTVITRDEDRRDWILGSGSVSAYQANWLSLDAARFVADIVLNNRGKVTAPTGNRVEI